MTELTKHFSLEEMTYTNKTGYKTKNTTEGKSIIGQLYNLAAFAENVRIVLDETPMTITSGFRCKELNKAIGGSASSQHVKGEAIDFVCKKLKPKDIFNKLKKSQLVFGQLILEKDTWIHISIGSKRECLVYDGTKYKKVN